MAQRNGHVLIEWAPTSSADPNLTAQRGSYWNCRNANGETRRLNPDRLAQRMSTLRAFVHRCLAPCIFLFCASLGPRVAYADENKMLILPTVIAPAKQCDADLKTAPPEPSTLQLARRIDTLLSDSVQDLDLSLEIAPQARAADEERKPSIPEEALVAMAESRWVVSPRLIVDGGKRQLRLVAVAPGSRVLAARIQEIEPTNVDVRAVVMLGDLVRSQSKGTAALGSIREPNHAAQGQPSVAARSEGRGVLAISSALLGGFTGYWLQRASGSADPRVTYPLTALGAGIGLGASMLVADEWDITTDDSWILTAGIGWPAASGYLLARGYDVQPASDRYIYALLGAGTGLTLASASISLHQSTPGGALMVHSGGAVGTFFGALTEWAWYGKTDFSPSKGMGVGAGLGVLAAGVLATQIDTSSTRVLFIDLGASLGALSGAALSSWLLFVQEGDLPALNKNRAWLGAVGAGTLIGGTVGWMATRHMSSSTQPNRMAVNYFPYFSLTSDPTVKNSSSSSGWVAGLNGTW